MSILLGLAVAASAAPLKLPESMRCDLATSAGLGISFGMAGEGTSIVPLGDAFWLNRRLQVASRLDEGTDTSPPTTTLRAAEGEFEFVFKLDGGRPAWYGEPRSTLTASISVQTKDGKSQLLGVGYCRPTNLVPAKRAGFADAKMLVSQLARGSIPNSCSVVNSDGERGTAKVELISAPPPAFDIFRIRFSGLVSRTFPDGQAEYRSYPVAMLGAKEGQMASLAPLKGQGFGGGLSIFRSFSGSSFFVMDFNAIGSEDAKRRIRLFCGSLTYSQESGK
ncbi:hypothetical protein [Novosphingobium sp.]|uniref:hypothetical protein n=1 Tax=Novosphingobium sp. TaxID=1874826 RepID=UPI00286D270F|nr:hypothetical protein [Novosphingobium sp.]